MASVPTLLSIPENDESWSAPPCPSCPPWITNSPPCGLIPPTYSCPRRPDSIYQKSTSQSSQGRTWKKFSTENGSLWWWADDNNYFLEKSTKWQRFRDPMSFCQYWWNPDTEEFFFIEEPFELNEEDIDDFLQLLTNIDNDRLRVGQTTSHINDDRNCTDKQN